MKIISFAVPCYNSAEYMNRCIDSLLVGGDDVEIIIINDGSTDNTGEIADAYAREFPSIIKVIHQENAGHGEGVNQGILHATGKYYKVVDSDDWLNEESLKMVLEVLREYIQKNIELDMILCNYVYQNNNYKRTCTINYKNVFPRDKIITWDDTKFFKPSQYIVMHSIIYSMDVIKKSKVKLPKHTFYVDSLFVYEPLPYVKNFYYINTDLYCYFIGREDQSVNELILQQRIDQQIFVTKLIIDSHNLKEVANTNKKLANYMARFVSIMMSISSIHLTLINTKESDNKKYDLWKYLEKKDKKLYYKVRLGTWAGLTKPRGKAYGKLLSLGYHTAQKIYKFN